MHLGSELRRDRGHVRTQGQGVCQDSKFPFFFFLVANFLFNIMKAKYVYGLMGRI